MEVWLADLEPSIPHPHFLGVTAKIGIRTSNAEDVRLLVSYLENFDINSLKPDYNAKKVAIEKSEAEDPEHECLEKYTKNPIDSLEL